MSHTRSSTTQTLITLGNKNLDGVTLHDYAIIACKNKATENYKLTGEFQYPSPQNAETELNRSSALIEEIMLDGARAHRTINCNNGDVPTLEHIDHLLKVATNEFFFFTQVPYTLKTFTWRLTKIMNLASSQPRNLHFALGSFPVLTQNNWLMNVVPYVQCGINPSLRLIVKNYSAKDDPVYIKKMSQDGKDIEYYYNVGYGDKYSVLDKTKDVLVPDLSCVSKIKINGKEYSFSFENVFTCKTLGGKKILICCDICLDQNEGVAKYFFSEQLKERGFKTAEGIKTKKFPLYFSHMVLSNSIDLKKKYKIGLTFQVDPDCSLAGCKSMTPQWQSDLIDATFGPPYYKIQVAPTLCDVDYSCKQQGFISIINNRMTYSDITFRLNEIEAQLSTSKTTVYGMSKQEYTLKLREEAAGYLIFFSKAMERKKLNTWFIDKTNVDRLTSWSQNRKFDWMNANQRLAEALSETAEYRNNRGKTL